MIAVVIVAAVIAVGLVKATGLRWYCDDAFITLRYADNFLAGKGLVYNEGEYVEGYTHPLWLALVILCQRLGFDPIAAALNLGLLSYAGVVLLFSLVSRRLNRQFAVFVPLTAVVLAIHRDFLIWVASGMETMFFTFLLSLAFWLYFYSGVTRFKKLVVSGAVLTLAVLTRPDAAVIVALANICLLMKERRLSSLLWFNLPAVCMLAPYLAWKLSYYGQILPNTYYAKSGGATYFSRGFFYIWIYLKAYLTSWLFLLVLPAMFLRKVRDKTLVFVFTGVLAYLTLFVARVGGDFMYARFLVPMIPFVFFAIESSVCRLWPGRRAPTIVLLAAIACSLVLVEIPKRNDMLHTITDDIRAEGLTRQWYKSHKGIIDEHHLRTVVDPIRNDRALGEFLEPYFRDLDVTVLLKGRACIGYYGKFKNCIEYYGLTDPLIAQSPLGVRDRVGHEKEATRDYILDRGVDFVFNGSLLYPDSLMQCQIAHLRPPDRELERIVQVPTYDSRLQKTLAERFARSGNSTLGVEEFEPLLNAYVREDLWQVDRGKFLYDYALISDYYFRHNDDSRLEAEFIKRLRSGR
jgi:hypothetical protein